MVTVNCFMDKRILTYLFALLSLPVLANGYDALYLFQKRQTAFTIVTSGNTISERKAAKELQQYLQEISGTRFPLKTVPTRHSIFVGYSEQYMKPVGLERMADHDESFTYLTKNGNIYIYGGSLRGTLYGVYAFLENEMGVKWLTPECTVTPRLKEKRVTEISSRTERPVFRYRQLLAYPINISHTTQTRWRLNELDWLSRAAAKAEYGATERYWGTHTLGKHFISAKKYFAAHPEYFSLWEGKRISNGQVCLSNANVLKICIAKMKQIIRENPGYIAYEISQNDNRRYCTCENCRRIESKYGGHAGIILWFVNQVARAIAKDFPGRLISTMAYQYTLQAPKGLRAENNVMIRISSSGACFTHPLSQQCNDGEARSDLFMDAIQGWHKICKHLYVWDYVVNFNEYSAPYPNFNVLAANLRLFHDYGANGVLEQGQRSSNGGEFAELKSWVLAKLLWNPYLNADSLAQAFISAYYGKAAEPIKDYFSLVQQLSTPNRHLRCVFNQQSKLYSQNFIERSCKLIEMAEQAVKGDSTMTNRVQLVKLQILSAKLLADSDSAIDGKTWSEYKALARKFKVKPRELQDLEPYIEQKEQAIQKRRITRTGLLSLPVLLLFIGYALRRLNQRKETEV